MVFLTKQNEVNVAYSEDVIEKLFKVVFGGHIKKRSILKWFPPVTYML